MTPILSWRDQHLTHQSFAEQGVFAYPTEAVYGLGCDPWDCVAVSNLLAIKQRSWEKGLILVAAHIDQFDFLIKNLTPKMRATLNKTWPGPITWLVPHQNLLPIWLTGKHPTIALRVSAHPVIQALCSHLNQPLISTSANLSGMPAAKHRLQVQKYFGKQLTGIVSGQLGKLKNPTEIQDLMTRAYIRKTH